MVVNSRMPVKIICIRIGMPYMLGSTVKIDPKQGCRLKNAGKIPLYTGRDAVPLKTLTNSNDPLGIQSVLAKGPLYNMANNNVLCGTS
jgi:hypothetical protein